MQDGPHASEDEHNEHNERRDKRRNTSMSKIDELERGAEQDRPSDQRQHDLSRMPAHQCPPSRAGGTHISYATANQSASTNPAGLGK